MLTKFALFSVALAVVASSGVVPVANVAITAKLSDSEYDPYPQYMFAYDVRDTLTGDFKSQVETRNGGVVQGQYSLNEPDGTRRIVDYFADPINGFNAVVNRGPQLVAAAPIFRTATAIAPVAPARIAPGLPLAPARIHVAAPSRVATARADVPPPKARIAPASPAVPRTNFPAPPPPSRTAQLNHAQELARISAPLAYSSAYKNV